VKHMKHDGAMGFVWRSGKTIAWIFFRAIGVRMQPSVYLQDLSLDRTKASLETCRFFAFHA